MKLGEKSSSLTFIQALSPYFSMKLPLQISDRYRYPLRISTDILYRYLDYPNQKIILTETNTTTHWLLERIYFTLNFQGTRMLAGF